VTHRGTLSKPLALETVPPPCIPPREP
jgi:hypothetical protein